MFAGTSSNGNSVTKKESDDDHDDDQEYMEIESLSASQIMELIELSFFQACYALSKGDIQPLKLFVIAVKTASKKYEGASALAISETVDSLLPSVRALDDRERKLRDTWIRAVYLMLGHVMEDFSGGDSSNPDEDDEVFKTYGPVLADLVAVHQTGMGLNVNQFVASRKDMLLLEPKNKNILVLDDEEENEDLVQLAVVTQTINVLFTTLVVLEEEAKSGDSTTNDDNSSSNSTINIEGGSSSKPSTSKNKKKSGSSSGRGFG